MLRRIEAQMACIGLTKKKLSEETGIRYKALLSKLSGSRAFTLDEALKVKAAIKSTESIETLFER
jgi:hypothetical protein